MNNTALGAVSNKKENIRFISEAHEKFYYEKLKEVRYVDVYHKALCYCLGISDDTRRNICTMVGRPVEAKRLSEWRSICIAMVHRV